MEYTLVQADAAADSFRGLQEVARFHSPDRGVAFLRDALRRGNGQARDWYLLDPAGRAVAGPDDLLDEVDQDASSKEA